MKDEYCEIFRRLFRLSDLKNQDDAIGSFRDLAKLAAWVELQKEDPSPSHDALFSDMADSITLWQSLPFYLATIDRTFFLRARRMAANTLLRNGNLPPYYRRVIALLLVLEPPKSKRPKATFDAIFVMGVVVAEELFPHPTEGVESKTNPGSSAAMHFMAEVRKYSPHSERTIHTQQKIWKQRKEKLKAVGFSEEEASDFLSPAFPTNDLNR
ncbi:hypothetical protein [Pseudooceanicola sp.]|uniref:hypothetical protein n=1 Tax=Pseudooceanicola sp. TaxID=1914328 RepID=UPI0035C6C8DB